MLACFQYLRVKFYCCERYVKYNYDHRRSYASQVTVGSTDTIPSAILNNIRVYFLNSPPFYISRRLAWLSLYKWQNIDRSLPSMSSSDQDSDTEQLHSMSEINFVGKGRRLDSQRDGKWATI